MSNKRNYIRYRMTYPHLSNSIYKSRHLSKIAKRCYKEFKNLNDIKEGMFIVTDLDNRKEYRFKVKNKKIYKLNKHKGGQEPKTSEFNQNNVKILLDHMTKQHNIKKDYNEEGKQISPISISKEDSNEKLPPLPIISE